MFTIRTGNKRTIQRTFKYYLNRSHKRRKKNTNRCRVAAPAEVSRVSQSRSAAETRGPVTSGPRV
eukprot:3919908-Rhodomonas_salina.1